MTPHPTETAATPHLMDTYGRLPVAFTRGEGVWLWDTAGKRYLDGFSGIAVTGLGHAHPRLIQAIAEQAGRIIHASNWYRIPEQERLADLLCELSGMDNVFFCNSGCEANEAAIKLARLYGHHKGLEQPTIVVMEKAFHGRTMATLSATGNRKVQAGFEPLLTGFARVPYNDLQALEQVAASNKSVVAVLVEPIQGEGGINLPDDGYLPGMRKLCDEAGILLIFDEIQTGMGRTGKLWAYEHSGVAPDIMTVAKALANGVPIGATLATDDVAKVFTPGTHGSTFGGNPLATAVGLTVFSTLIEDKLAERAERMGKVLVQGLEAIRAKHPKAVKEIRGRGLLVGLDLVPPVADAVAACRERGLLVLTAGDNTLRLAPPLIVLDKDVAEACAIIDAALASVAI